MVTQVEIAKRIGLDVSSVNKILNEVPGPSFKLETRKRVFRIAQQMGYPLKRETKHSLRLEKAELKSAVEDLYNTLFGTGFRAFKPETLATIQKHIEQHRARKQVATG